MIYFIYSEETASSNIAYALSSILGLKEGEFHGFPCFSGNKIRMLKISGNLINANFIDSIVDGVTVFLSRHSSSMGIPAFTVHAEGNWSDENTLGGEPRRISVSSPLNMLKVLGSINKENAVGMQVTYEATHHGPLMEHPSFFAELGGNESVLNNKEYAMLFADAIMKSMDSDAEYDNVAVGIGGTHYPRKFTDLALKGKYAFSHIMPKYYTEFPNMLEAALERSDIKAEIAVMEWKGIKAVEREVIVRELNRLGIDYAKV